VNLTRLLAVGLRDLSFTDNYVSFEETIVIPATSEFRVRNSLNVEPSRYIIVSQEGNGLITKSTTEWTDDFLYLYNNGSVTVTITVIFFK
jgi:hypothetical protein